MSHAPSNPPAETTDALWNRRAWSFLLALTALRLLMHAFGLIGVTGDEAYYWEWGNHPALGYYSKPPLVGWLMGFLENAGLGTTFGLKMTATLLFGVALWGLYDFTRQWFGTRTAWWTLAICGLSIGSFGAGSLLTIDAILLPPWAIALSAGSRVLRNGPTPPALLTLTLALGIGMLGKQMMMLFPVLLFIAAWRLKVPRRTWIALVTCSLLSFLALTPPMIWNAQHGWATFRHTAHHFEPAPVTPAAIIGRLKEFVLVQLGIAGPVALVLAIVVLFNRESRHRYRIPLIFGAIGWTVMLLMNFRQEVNANWTAVYLFSWLPAGVAWALDHRPKLARAALWTNAALTLLAILGAIAFATWNTTVLGLENEKAGFAKFIYSKWPKGDKKLWPGWDELAREAESMQTPAPAGEKPLLIVAGNRFTAAQIAFRSVHRPELHTWYYGHQVVPATGRERGPTSQFDFWAGPSTPTNRPLVLVVDEFLKVPEELQNALVNPTPPKRVHIRFGTKSSADFEIIHADGLTSWPAPAFP